MIGSSPYPTSILVSTVAQRYQEEYSVVLAFFADAPAIEQTVVRTSPEAALPGRGL